RARYLNFIRMLRKHMKSLRFFLFYRGIFATQKSKPLFFSASTALAPAVRPDDGCEGVIFRGGRCEAHDPKFPRGFCSLYLWE
ncbi:hypothetical protein AD948_00185, partial [Acetobacter senegalensis]